MSNDIQIGIDVDINNAKAKAKELEDSFEDVGDSLGDSLGEAFEQASKESQSFLDKLKAGIPDSIGGLSLDSILGGIAGGGALGIATKGFELIAGSIKDVYNNANEFNNALLDIQAKTGATKDEMKLLETASKEAFLGGVGESVADATRIIGEAQTLLGSTFTGAELGDFTAKANALGNLFDKDVNEVLQKATPFIKQFGLSSDEAFNLLSKGLREGKTPSDDLLDTLSEYSQLISKAGFSAGEFTQILTNGAGEGIFSLDKLGDAIKETEIRLKAGDIGEGLTKIGGSNDFENNLIRQIQAIEKAGSDGTKTVKEVLQESTELINNAYNDGQISETLSSQLQVAIAGTPAEDIGTELFGKIFSAPLDEASIQASAQRIGTEVSNAVGQYNPFDQFKRQSELLVTVIGADVISFATNTLSFLADNFDKIAIAIGIAGTAMLIYNASTIAGAVATKAVAVATGVWNAVLALNPVVAVGIGVAALIVGVLALADAMSESTEEQLESNQAQLEQLEQQKDLNRQQKEGEQDSLKLIKRYEELGKNSKKTAQEQKEFEQAQLKLAETYPGVISGTADFSTNLENLQLQADKTRTKIGELDNQYSQLNETQKRLQKEQLNLQVQLAEETAFKEFEVLFGIGGGDLKALFNKAKNQITSEWDSAGLNNLGLQLQTDAFDQLKELGADNEEIQAFQNGLKSIIDLQKQRITANGGAEKSTEELEKVSENLNKVDINGFINQLKTLNKEGKSTTTGFSQLFTATTEEFAKLNNISTEEATKQLNNLVFGEKGNGGIKGVEKAVKEANYSGIVNQLAILNIEGKKATETYRNLVSQALNLRKSDDELKESLESVNKELDIYYNGIKNITSFSEKDFDISKFLEKAAKDARENFKKLIIPAKVGIDDFLEYDKESVALFGADLIDRANEIQNQLELIGKDTTLTEKDRLEQETKLKKEFADLQFQSLLNSVSAIDSAYLNSAVTIAKSIKDNIDLIDKGGDSWIAYGNILSSVLKQGEELFKDNTEIQRAFAVSQAIINTALAAIIAYRDLGPIAGTIAAAVISSFGALQVATILGAEDGVVGLDSSYNKKPGRTDTIPFMLAKGESVINAQSTAVNRPFLEYANNGGNLADLFNPLLSETRIQNRKIDMLNKNLSRNSGINLIVDNRNNSRIRAGRL